MTDQKIKTAAKKPPLALVPFIWLYGVARVLAYGAKKYAKGNHYTATLDDDAGERYAGATLRHLADMQEPDGTWSRASLAARDHESGLPSIDHALCSLGILRGILVKEGVLPADPGEAKEPPAGDGWVNAIAAITRPDRQDVTMFEFFGQRDEMVRRPAPIRDWATIESVVLDHPDPERPLPPRDVVEAEARAGLAVEDCREQTFRGDTFKLADIEAPEPAAGDTVVVDVAEPVLIRDRRTEHGRQFWDRAEADEAGRRLALGPVSERILEVLKHADGGPMSFAYIRGMVDCYGQELLGVLGAMQVAGLVVKDAAGYSLAVRP